MKNNSMQAKYTLLISAVSYLIANAIKTSGEEVIAGAFFLLGFTTLLLGIAGLFQERKTNADRE